MNLDKHIKNNRILLRVIPNAKKAELIEDNYQLRLYLKSSPEDNKANKELIKFFKKELNLNVIIRSGQKSKDKVLEIY